MRAPTGLRLRARLRLPPAPASRAPAVACCPAVSLLLLLQAISSVRPHMHPMGGDACGRVVRQPGNATCGRPNVGMGGRVRSARVRARAALVRRFRYSGLKSLMLASNQILEEHRRLNDGLHRNNEGQQYAGIETDDAFSTILQWLHSRMADVRSTASGRTAT